MFAPAVDRPTHDEYVRLLAGQDLSVVCIDLDLRVTCISQALADAIGRSDDECVGAPLADLLGPPDVDEAVQAEIAEMRAGRRDAVRAEFHPTLSDGTSPTWEFVTHVRRGPDGEQVGWMATVRDVTAEREAELTLRHGQKLESVGRLAAGIAHEINTPIQFIGDNLYFLSESFDRVVELLARYRSALDGSSGQMSWQERQEMLASAEDQADLEFVMVEVPDAVESALGGVGRVASIVKAMKAFGHPDTAEGQPVDVNEIIRNTLIVARNEMKYVAEVSVDYGLVPIITGQPGDLGQVFLNLFVNAADAVRDVVGGSGDLGRIDVVTATDDDHVVVTVTDTGTGIPEEVATHVFEPFFTTKEVGKGTGQGLSLSHAIVDRHGGTIAFGPGPDGGTRFTVRLPAATPGEPLI